MKRWLTSILTIVIIASLAFWGVQHFTDFQDKYADWYDSQGKRFFQQDRETHGFGTYNNNLSFDGDDRHYGIDYRLPVGSDVLAPTNGTVTNIFTDDLGGKVLEVQETNGQYFQWFMHLSDYNVNVGDTIEAGEVIAQSGNSGEQTTGPHLHFQRMKGGASNKFAEDPAEFVEQLPEGQQSLYRVNKAQKGGVET